MVPGYNKPIVVAKDDAYFLSQSDGKKLPVLAAKGHIKGDVSLLYVLADGKENLALKYDVTTSFTGSMKEIVLLAPA